MLTQLVSVGTIWSLFSPTATPYLKHVFQSWVKGENAENGNESDQQILFVALKISSFNSEHFNFPWQD